MKFNRLQQLLNKADKTARDEYEIALRLKLPTEPLQQDLRELRIALTEKFGAPKTLPLKDAAGNFLPRARGWYNPSENKGQVTVASADVQEHDITRKQATILIAGTKEWHEHHGRTVKFTNPNQRTKANKAYVKGPSQPTIVSTGGTKIAFVPSFREKAPTYRKGGKTSKQRKTLATIANEQDAASLFDELKQAYADAWAEREEESRRAWEELGRNSNLWNPTIDEEVNEDREEEEEAQREAVQRDRDQESTPTYLEPPSPFRSWAR